MTELDPEAFDKAVAQLEALRGTIPDEQLDQMLGRLFVSTEELKEELKGEVLSEIEEELELGEMAETFPLERIRESDRQVKLGYDDTERTITIRYLHMADFERMTGYIPEAIRAVYKRGPKKLKDLTVKGLVMDVIQHGFGRKGMNDFKQLCYEELAECLTNLKTGQIVTAEDLRADCLPGQLIAAAKAVYEVNERFFGELWAVVPGVIRTPLGSSFGMIMNDIKSLGLKALALRAKWLLAGGTPNGGTTSGLTPSPQNTNSASPKSGQWTSSEPGGTSRPSADAETEKGMSSGEPLKPLATTTADQLGQEVSLG